MRRILLIAAMCLLAVTSTGCKKAQLRRQLKEQMGTTIVLPEKIPFKSLYYAKEKTNNHWSPWSYNSPLFCFFVLLACKSSVELGNRLQNVPSFGSGKSHD